MPPPNGNQLREPNTVNVNRGEDSSSATSEGSAAAQLLYALKRGSVHAPPVAKGDPLVARNATEAVEDESENTRHENNMNWVDTIRSFISCSVEWCKFCTKWISWIAFGVLIGSVIFPNQLAYATEEWYGFGQSTVQVTDDLEGRREDLALALDNLSDLESLSRKVLGAASSMYLLTTGNYVAAMVTALLTELQSGMITGWTAEFETRRANIDQRLVNVNSMNLIMTTEKLNGTQEAYDLLINATVQLQQDINMTNASLQKALQELEAYKQDASNNTDSEKIQNTTGMIEDLRLTIQQQNNSLNSATEKAMIYNETIGGLKSQLKTLQETKRRLLNLPEFIVQLQCHKTGISLAIGIMHALVDVYIVFTKRG